MTQDIVEAVARGVHEALSRANVMAYLDMPSDTADVVARAILPIAAEYFAGVAYDAATRGGHGARGFERIIARDVVKAIRASVEPTP